MGTKKMQYTQKETIRPSLPAKDTERCFASGRGHTDSGVTSHPGEPLAAVDRHPLPPAQLRTQPGNLPAAVCEENHVSWFARTTPGDV